MTFRYPNGKTFVPNRSINHSSLKKEGFANRGMTLEEDLNETNEYYLNQSIAVIHKKPTPVQIVTVDYPARSAAVIKEAYFKQASTTDYNGIYKGKYIDFEAKETKNKTSLPLRNFHAHQIDHMKRVVLQGGIAFIILRFSSLDQYYLLDSQYLFTFWDKSNNGGRKSIPLDFVVDNGYEISIGFHPRIDYLKIVDQIYLNT